jgi:hypothetical protein
MPNYTVQLRRGTTAEHSSFTGAAGEITVNTSNNSIHVHNGSTAGGTELATRAALIANTENAIIDADADTHVKVETSSDADTIDFTVAGTTIAKMNATGLIPTVNSNGTTGFDLGASGAKWRDLYLSAGSLFVDGQKVLQSDSGTILLSASVDQGLTVKTTGTGQSTVQSAAGVNLTATGSADITLTTASGQLEINADTIINAGKSITSSNASAIAFGSALSVSGTVTGTTFIGAVTGAVTGTVTSIANHDTADLSEGTNLYYTNSRADARITAALIDEDNMASDSATRLPSQQSVKSYVDTKVAAVVDSAPAALDTLNELAASLGDDANFATTVSNNIGTKLALAGGTMSGDINLGGNDITNGGTFNGTATAVASNSVTLSTHTTGNYVQQGATSGSGISGSVNSEGGTFTVASNATAANTGSTIVFRDGSGNFAAGTISAVATSAQYADLAERYHSGAPIEAGTVVSFGGENEIEASNEDASTRVAGVVSTAPAFMMNKDAGDDSSHPYVALAGRVPCKVTGEIKKGDMLVSAANGHAKASAFVGGAMIGKALEDFDGETGTIEILVNLM